MRQTGHGLGHPCSCWCSFDAGQQPARDEAAADKSWADCPLWCSGLKGHVKKTLWAYQAGMLAHQVEDIAVSQRAYTGDWTVSRSVGQQSLKHAMEGIIPDGSGRIAFILLSSAPHSMPLVHAFINASWLFGADDLLARLLLDSHVGHIRCWTNGVWT